MEDMYLELVRDNDEVIDAMGDVEVQLLISLLKRDKNPLFLEMLSVLCECDDTAKIGHQNRIVTLLLEKSKGVLFDIKLDPMYNVAMISIAGPENDWMSLRKFVVFIMVFMMAYLTQFFHI
jgi:hypothetical protein